MPSMQCSIKKHLSSFFASFCVCVSECGICSYVCKVHACVWSQSRVILYFSQHYSCNAGSLTEPEASAFQAHWQSASPSDLPVSTLLSAGIIILCGATPGLLHGCWISNSGPDACRPRALNY